MVAAPGAQTGRQTETGTSLPTFTGGWCIYSNPFRPWGRVEGGEDDDGVAYGCPRLGPIRDMWWPSGGDRSVAPGGRARRPLPASPRCPVGRRRCANAPSARSLARCHVRFRRGSRTRRRSPRARLPKGVTRCPPVSSARAGPKPCLMARLSTTSSSSRRRRRCRVRAASPGVVRGMSTTASPIASR